MPRSFKLVETLGEGAFGAVHLAEVQGDEGLVQTLAVKWLHPEWSHDEELVGRLRDEARLLALLQHDNVVRVHGLTRISGRLAILMEPIQGVDLCRLDGERMPPRAALEVVEGVADALVAAWETVPPGQTEPLRVVHRDIKPSNLMLTPRGNLKVMDFGVARATFGSREAKTRSQQFGTARYMAPERWLEGIADAESDVFSLGVTLVELLTGEPVERPRLSRAAFQEDLEGSLARLAAWPEIQDLAERMCAYSPTDRPSAREIVAWCHSLAEEAPGPTLRRWALAWVPPRMIRDESGDQVVREDASGETFALGALPTHDPTLPLEPSPPSVPPSEGRLRRWILPLGAMILAIALLAWALSAEGLSVPGETAPPAAIPEDPVSEPPEVPASPPPAEPEPGSGEVSERATVSPRPRAAPAPVDERPRSIVTFILDPPGLEVSTPHGPVRHRQAIDLPQEVVQVTVENNGERWSCTVQVDAAITTWRIDGHRQGCNQVY